MPSGRGCGIEATGGVFERSDCPDSISGLPAVSDGHHVGGSQNHKTSQTGGGIPMVSNDSEKRKGWRQWLGFVPVRHERWELVLMRLGVAWVTWMTLKYMPLPF